MRYRLTAVFALIDDNSIPVFKTKLVLDLGNYGNNGKGPVWWYPMEKMYSPDNCPSDVELNTMKTKLAIEIDRLL